MDINELREFLDKAWSEEASAAPDDWSSDIYGRIWGQCVVMALIVQDYFGGEILHVKIEVDGVFGSHHWNRLPDGTEIDLTRRYLPENTIIPTGKVRARSVLERALPSLPEVVKKYEILKTKIEAARDSGR